jgi:hypothetical protein
MSGEQLSMFEPTGAEVGQLASGHLRRANVAMREFELWEARGCSALAAAAHERVRAHWRQADELAMLAEFERLAGFA